VQAAAGGNFFIGDEQVVLRTGRSSLEDFEEEAERSYTVCGSDASDAAAVLFILWAQALLDMPTSSRFVTDILQVEFS
jgi:hypothetical protein